MHFSMDSTLPLGPKCVCATMSSFPVQSFPGVSIAPLPLSKQKRGSSEGQNRAHVTLNQVAPQLALRMTPNRPKWAPTNEPPQGPRAPARPLYHIFPNPRFCLDIVFQASPRCLVCLLGISPWMMITVATGRPPIFPNPGFGAKSTQGNEGGLFIFQS